MIFSLPCEFQWKKDLKSGCKPLTLELHENDHTHTHTTLYNSLYVDILFMHARLLQEQKADSPRPQSGQMKIFTVQFQNYSINNLNWGCWSIIQMIASTSFNDIYWNLD